MEDRYPPADLPAVLVKVVSLPPLYLFNLGSATTHALVKHVGTLTLRYDQKLCRVKTFFDAISALFA